jgi:hypothetical protein
MTRIGRVLVCAAVSLVVVSAGRAEAQWFQGAGYIGVGFAGTATGELDDVLTARGYPEFGSSSVLIGIGAYATIAGRLMLGGEWNGLIKDSQEYQGREMYLGGGYGTLGVGWAIDVSRRVRVYPRVGIGVGGFGLTFETAEDTVDFDDTLADPDAEADRSRGFQPSFTKEHGVMDVGAGAELLRARSGRGTLVGLRIGYLFAPSDTEWEFNRRAVTGGPEASVAGPYIRVILGAGARR